YHYAQWIRADHSNIERVYAHPSVSPNMWEIPDYIQRILPSLPAGDEFQKRSSFRMSHGGIDPNRKAPVRRDLGLPPAKHKREAFGWIANDIRRKFTLAQKWTFLRNDFWIVSALALYGLTRIVTLGRSGPPAPVGFSRLQIASPETEHPVLKWRIIPASVLTSIQAHEADHLAGKESSNEVSAYRAELISKSASVQASGSLLRKGLRGALSVLVITTIPMVGATMSLGAMGTLLVNAYLVTVVVGIMGRILYQYIEESLNKRSMITAIAVGVGFIMASVLPVSKTLTAAGTSHITFLLKFPLFFSGEVILFAVGLIGLVLITEKLDKITNIFNRQNSQEHRNHIQKLKLAYETVSVAIRLGTLVLAGYILYFTDTMGIVIDWVQQYSLKAQWTSLEGMVASIIPITLLLMVVATGVVYVYQWIKIGKERLKDLEAYAAKRKRGSLDEATIQKLQKQRQWLKTSISILVAGVFIDGLLLNFIAWGVYPSLASWMSTLKAVGILAGYIAFIMNLQLRNVKEKLGPEAISVVASMKRSRWTRWIIGGIVVGSFLGVATGAGLLVIGVITIFLGVNVKELALVLQRRSQGVLGIISAKNSDPVRSKLPVDLATRRIIQERLSIHQEAIGAEITIPGLISAKWEATNVLGHIGRKDLIKEILKHTAVIRAPDVVMKDSLLEPIFNNPNNPIYCINTRIRNNTQPIIIILPSGESQLDISQGRNLDFIIECIAYEAQALALEGKKSYEEIRQQAEELALYTREFIQENSFAIAGNDPTILSPAAAAAQRTNLLPITEINASEKQRQEAFGTTVGLEIELSEAEWMRVNPRGLYHCAPDTYGLAKFKELRTAPSWSVNLAMAIWDKARRNMRTLLNDVLSTQVNVGLPADIYKKLPQTVESILIDNLAQLNLAVVFGFDLRLRVLHKKSYKVALIRSENNNIPVQGRQFLRVEHGFAVPEREVVETIVDLTTALWHWSIREAGESNYNEELADFGKEIHQKLNQLFPIHINDKKGSAKLVNLDPAIKVALFDAQTWRPLINWQGFKQSHDAIKPWLSSMHNRIEDSVQQAHAMATAVQMREWSKAPSVWQEAVKGKEKRVEFTANICETYLESDKELWSLLRNENWDKNRSKAKSQIERTLAKAGLSTIQIQFIFNQIDAHEKKSSHKAGIIAQLKSMEEVKEDVKE
ncbi:MAG: hypothetical protein WCH62_06825, partial [Candidatus Omnitrophota bacterium]